MSEYGRLVLLALAGAILLVIFALPLRARLPRTASPASNGERLAWLTLLLSITALAGTSFYSVITEGRLHGWWLLAHSAATAPFLLALPAVALLAGVRHTAGAGVRTWLFWAVVLSCGVLAGSMLVTMLPWAGYDAQLWWIQVHRYAALALTVLMPLYIVLWPRAAQPGESGEKA